LISKSIRFTTITEALQLVGVVERFRWEVRNKPKVNLISDRLNRINFHLTHESKAGWQSVPKARVSLLQMSFVPTPDILLHILPIMVLPFWRAPLGRFLFTHFIFSAAVGTLYWKTEMVYWLSSSYDFLLIFWLTISFFIYVSFFIFKRKILEKIFFVFAGYLLVQRLRSFGFFPLHCFVFHRFDPRKHQRWVGKTCWLAHGWVALGFFGADCGVRFKGPQRVRL